MKELTRDWRHAVPLALISILAAMPMLVMAIHRRIEYDGWWHVFIARQSPWRAFWREVYFNAHPPLYYLLLKAVSALGHDRVVYRSVAILAAIAAIVAIGSAGRRLFDTPALSLICSGAFGFSVVTATMACEVRSYMLSVAFVLAAFVQYLDLVNRPVAEIAPRSSVLFASFTLAAILSHYFTIFFLFAALVYPFVRGTFDGQFRSMWRDRLTLHWRRELVPIAIVIAAAASLYVVHASRYTEPMNYIPQFYPGAGESSWSFTTRILFAEANLFSPVPLAIPAAWQGLFAFAILAAGVWLLLRASNAGISSAFLVLIAGGMFIASLAGHYPFGGALRHQFLLYPFLLLTIFELSDGGMKALKRRPALRWISITMLTLIVVANGVWSWRNEHYIREEMLTAEAGRYRRDFTDPEAVYVDQFSLIPFFTNHHQFEWAGERRLTGPFATIPVTGPGRSFLVIRDKSRWNSDLSDPELYRDLYNLSIECGVRSIDVFHVTQNAAAFPKRTLEWNQAMDRNIKELVRAEGMKVERLVIDGQQVFLRLRRP